MNFSYISNLTFWNLGGNTNFFSVILWKLEPSCKIKAYSAAIFRKVLYKKWPPLALSLSQYYAFSHRYHIYKEVWNPSIGEAFICFAEEVNSYDRKAIISTSDNISKRNTAFESSSGANIVVRHCSRGVYSHYAIPRGTALAKSLEYLRYYIL